MQGEDLFSRVEAALAQVEQDQPVAMLNLLRFHDQAQYAEAAHEAPCTGAEAYKRYGEAVTPLLQKLGAEVLLSGVAELLGPTDEWDRIVVVRYPTRSAFESLLQMPEYRTIAHHRTAAVRDARLTMMKYSGTALTG